MGIAEELAQVDRCFVPADVVISEIARAEGVKEAEAARWFLNGKSMPTPMVMDEHARGRPRELQSDF